MFLSKEYIRTIGYGAKSSIGGGGGGRGMNASPSPRKFEDCLDPKKAWECNNNKESPEM